MLKEENGPLDALWISYIDMVDNVCLALMRSLREDSWNQPFKTLAVHCAEMSQLRQKHPDIFEHFQNGGFSAEIGKENLFGRIPIDQAETD